MKSSKGKLLTVPFDRWFANRRREYLAMDREDSEGKVFSLSPFSFFHGIWILPTPLSDPGVPFRVTASNYEIIDEKRREKSRGSNRGESVGKNRMKYGKGGRGKLCELASWRDILRWFAPERQVLSAPDAEKRHSVEFLRFDLNLVIPKFAEFAEVWIITGCCADFADATWGLFFARAVCVQQRGYLEDNGETCSLSSWKKNSRCIKIDDYSKTLGRISRSYFVILGKVEQLSEMVIEGWGGSLNRIINILRFPRCRKYRR